MKFFIIVPCFSAHCFFFSRILPILYVWPVFEMKYRWPNQESKVYALNKYLLAPQISHNLQPVCISINWLLVQFIMAKLFKNCLQWVQPLCCYCSPTQLFCSMKDSLICNTANFYLWNCIFPGFFRSTLLKTPFSLIWAWVHDLWIKLWTETMEPC